MSRDIKAPEGSWAYAWAKSPDLAEQWLPLWRHLADTAGVAEYLWGKWLSDAARAVVEREVGGAEPARSIAVFLAGAHDVGKISEEFASQNPVLRDRMAQKGFAIRASVVSNAERKAWPHGSVSARSLRDFLHELLGQRAQESTLTSVLAGHHGSYPARAPSSLVESDPVWAQARRDAIRFVMELSGITELGLKGIATTGLTQAAQVLLTGFVVTCDWIASNQELFPYSHESFGPDRIQLGLSSLALPLPWSPAPPQVDSELFATRFDFPPGASPRPVQVAAVEQAREMTEPELMIVEAQTGEGKTEAAFAAAEVIAETFGCGGVTVALPTCATSDAMFSRTLRWLENSVPAGTEASAILTHSRARFNPEFTGLSAALPERGLRGIHDDASAESGSITAHWWLRARKKSALADFTVGTIDQVLFLALRSRHLMLRHLGAAGKVVILDEVHSADSYMAHFLDRALEWLGALGVPVVALTATLTPARRVAMLAAYRRGRHAADGRPITAGIPPEPDLDLAAAASGLPLISRIGAGGPAVVSPSASGRKTRYHLEFLGDDQVDLIREVVSAVECGACVIVVRNTVARAQAVYSDLLGELGSARTTLLHSRFILADRLDREAEIKEKLGPPDPGRVRPRGMVIVSTQIVESSLDIDADLMFTDLAPIDLLVQRAGRVHRHARPAGDRPGSVSDPRIVLTGVSVPMGGSVPLLDKGSEYVYGTAALLRTLAVLTEHLGRSDGVIESPGDISDLVRDTYAHEAAPPPGWDEAWAAAEVERAAMDTDRVRRSEVFRIRPPGPGPAYGWNTDASDEPREEAAGHAQVRDAENSLDVVVVREVDGRVRSLPWLAIHGDEIIDDKLGPNGDVARAVAMCTVSLPAWTFRGAREDRMIDDLERRGIPGWQASPWLKGMLPLRLDEELRLELGDLHFEYSRETGLSVRVKENT